MRQIFEKNMRMLSNLLSYCHEMGGERYEVEMEPGCAKSTMVIRAHIENIDPKKLRKLVDTLEIPRQRDMEQNYWYLGGESETGSNLTLVAVMIDSAAIQYKDQVLTIRIEREE